MAVRDPSGVQASGSLSSSSRTFCIFCPPMPHVLKHSKTVFQDMNKTTTKGYVGWVWGGGDTEVVAFVHTSRNSYKKSTHVTRATPKLCSITRTLNCTRYAVEKNINEFITFHYYFSFHYCHYITLSITSKNTIVSRLYLNERTHLPLANMDWANCLIKIFLFFLFL